MRPRDTPPPRANRWRVKLQLSAVELDTSIQCRATIDTAVVNDYAERMEAGDTFPPIDVFGSKSKCWLGDGWHRTMAARQNGAVMIEAKVHPGGRLEALKHALGANALHGHRRTNADKRRCVEIALREFPKLSSRAVAEMCGVGHEMVEAQRPQLAVSASSTRTGQDGKERAARREPRMKPRGVDFYNAERPRPVLGPPRDGLDFARLAVMDLAKIRSDDAEREQAFVFVKEWIDRQPPPRRPRC